MRPKNFAYTPAILPTEAKVRTPPQLQTLKKRLSRMAAILAEAPLAANHLLLRLYSLFQRILSERKTL